jgi:lipopolysaccharide transport system ATP-binding protein
MSSPIISVENLSKCYSIRHESGGRRYRRLSEELAAAIAWPFRRRIQKPDVRHKRSDVGEQKLELGTPTADVQPPTSEHFWALRNVSFDVNEGEVVGIVGRNGAGKSTLLKILSRITEPTEGRVTLRGRVASLLEVGTGFHPELTGRENIYLNGAVLGMTRSEIKKKFDEIVAFAEVEKFLDTPVKHYSSGMYVRLAFAVAAHLEPEILVVDEVLAVGDAEFQKKCLGKMGEVARGGRTVLFVSHNMAAIRTLCRTGVLLQNGSVAAAGSIENVTFMYIEANSSRSQNHTIAVAKPSERLSVWMESVSILVNGVPNSTIETGDELSFSVAFRSAEPIRKPIVGYLIRSSRGENAVNANNYFLKSSSYRDAVTEGAIVCDLGALPLMAGTYSVSFWLCRNPHEQHHIEDALWLTVEEKDIWGTGALPSRACSCLWWPTQFAFLPKT